MEQLQNLISFEMVLLALAACTTAGILAYRTFSKNTPEQKLSRLIILQDVTVGAWHAVEGLAHGTIATWDDKLAAALKKVAETISAQTGKALTDGEKAAVSLKLEALQGAKLTGLAAPSPTSPLLPPMPR